MSNVHQGLEVMVTMLVGTFVLPRQRGGHRTHNKETSSAEETQWLNLGAVRLPYLKRPLSGRG